MERWWGARPFSFFPGPLLRPFRGFGRERTMWAPRMDVYEKDNSIFVKVELPGLKKEDVTIEMEGDALIIRGESKAESEVKEEDYYRLERTYGSFYRRLPLPTGVSRDQVEANLKDGVLEVHIPKPVDTLAENKTIPVT
jgi:HSP20 family protein